MNNILELLIPLIIVILSVVLGNSRRRKTRQNAERRAEENTQNTLAEAGDNAAPPPFMEDFPFATEFEEMMTQQDEEETEAVPETPEEPEPSAPEEPPEPVRASQPQPPPVPVKSPANIRSIPVTSLLDFSPQAFRQGIVLKEILERPRSRRNRRNR